MMAGLPLQGPAPSDEAEAEARWWRHEALHRRALKHLPAALGAIAQERDELDARFLARINAVLTAFITDQRQVLQTCREEADAAEDRWIRTLSAQPRGP